jgi:hypothetical protein
MWFKDYENCINCLHVSKNKLILHIKLKIINQLLEGGGAQNYVIWPRAQKCVNSVLGIALPFLPSALHGGEWSASPPPPTALTPGKKIPVDNE